MNSRTLLGLAVAGCTLVSGCAHYYRVVDPETDKVFFTSQLNREQSGSVIFSDDRTKQDVTLSASEVKEIPEEQYEVGRSGAPTRAPG